MTVGDREIFGPVTIIKRVKTFEEGLAIMNANPFANGSVIFTQSGYYARQFELLTDGGMVGINVGIPFPPPISPSPAIKIPSLVICTFWGRTACAFTPVPRPLPSIGTASTPTKRPWTPGRALWSVFEPQAVCPAEAECAADSRFPRTPQGCGPCSDIQIFD